ncbi:hypothetical protein A5722_30750 [Mycobacterium vulneris]|uniref:hypothetical protein n=1 Tax=Mycolicibacterium porcinum TaxID=39693 RepID=UPI00080AD2C4|nr:hypothetical protein [Mycolicibacterium porcinum]OCB16030.1 hypothetical protein A5717_05915 [Mycolicibacterium porcinum]OCB51713.1 hypothetical protein A5722_30750 [Mycolicibacterium vulneris]OCB65398.1 hypothetical protein A5729_16130 [Mycolicibacterium vulneris]
MGFKKSVGASAMAAGIGMAGLLGLGLGTASADPGPGCDRPGAPQCDRHDDRGSRPDDWHGRDIDAGRRDHQPFEWNGQRVTPMPAGDGRGWGFWFLGTWIPL